MSDARPQDRVVRLIVVLGVIGLLGVRLHVLDDDFPNPDIAGIVYSAELLLDGGLPHVDTVDMKPVGSFVLVAGIIAVLGRSLEAIQLAHALWLLLGGVGVWWSARAVFDREDDELLGPRCAAVATAVYLVSVAMFTYNYSSWMTPAYALSVGMALRGLRRDSLRWSVGAGALALLAFATIQRAGPLALLLPGLWLWARTRPGPRARLAHFGAWGLGAALALLPLLALYAGALGPLFRSLFPVAIGVEYTTATSSPVTAALLGAAVQLATTHWFPVSVIGLAALAAWRSEDSERSLWIPGVLWFAATLVGVSLGGMRYYLHYLVQYAPALGLLAGHPALVRLGTAARADPPQRAAQAMLAAALLLSAGQLVEIGLGKGARYEAMARRLTGGLTAAQAAGRHIREQTTPEQTVQAWGWTAWRIYYWAQRRAPGRVYKPLGLITTPTSNTSIDAGGELHFRDGPLAQDMIAAFDRAPPAYFVYSPSMVSTFGATVDPLQEFTALRTRLERDYVREAQYGDLTLLRRRGAPARGPR